MVETAFGEREVGGLLTVKVEVATLMTPLLVSNTLHSTSWAVNRTIGRFPPKPIHLLLDLIKPAIKREAQRQKRNTAASRYVHLHLHPSIRLFTSLSIRQ